MLQNPYTFWFVAGSQHLYGEQALLEVEHHARSMVNELNKEANLPFEVKFKSVLTLDSEIHKLMIEANSSERCAGLIAWMHTFSPGKMWINGLAALQKPFLHLHTQFHRDIPWSSIDMDFMNVNQSAHGDREFGYTVTRVGLSRKVIAGYWRHSEVQRRVGQWMQTATAIQESRKLKVARFGDNMRSVAVTEGDKVGAHIQFGWTVDYYGIGDLVERINEVQEEQVNLLFKEYRELYEIDSQTLNSSSHLEAIREQARIELGLKAFLEEGSYTAFTTNFEDLHGMKQLPGLAAQRLMADGYGFAGEGDWKTAALTRLIKGMSHNQSTSFMEDYTYHLEPGNEMILGSHMLEVCPTISSSKPKVVVHPLGIGGKEDPARLLFDGKTGKGIVVSLIDLGGRFRMVMNEIEAVASSEKTPNLPVAKMLWKPLPSFSVATEGWIYAGGAHHTVLSLSVTKEQVMDLAELFKIECVTIDQETRLDRLQQELRINEVVWRMSR
ncbi:L-arabinose isomerase [Bacillus horti]|uniref:L-arabinose isomerase n=1 Tax=Caldalkalibacillus horti TaxID=77523 RepID=A0ABT9W241_9BACI|nr:L-arabinose isomerase [Bacillus horti]